MSAWTAAYRNPDAPVGYSVQEEKTEERDDDFLANVAFLLKELEDFQSDSDSDENIDHFQPNADSEGSSEGEVQDDDDVDARKSPIKKEARKKDAVASTSSSRAVSPRTREKKKMSKYDKSPTKIKRERRDSDSSDHSGYYSRHRSHRQTRSPSPVRVKQEMVPEHLFGCYHCDVCNLTLNSKLTYDAHVTGKRHKKALNKTMNVVDTVARSVPATEVECKKPMPAPGIKRVKVKAEAHLQKFIDKEDVPLPGLHHVSEIRGFRETSYFCAMCNAPCSNNSIMSHLRGFKHMMKTLKMYKPDLYEQYSYKQKYQIEDKVRKILLSIEKKEGRGFITVEEDKLSVESTGEELVPTSFHSQPSTSQAGYMDFKEYYDQTTIPDTSKSGYYCRVCESHMNSLDMWENHIGGKRHIKNARKMPGSIPSKIKTIPMKDAQSNLTALLRDVEIPVVGLNHIRETQNRQTGKDMYQCYLCSGCLNTNNIVDHVVSHKHRVSYLKEVRDDCLYVVKDMDINGPNAYAMVEDACARIEAEVGRGNPLVFFSKDSFPPNAV